MKRKTNLHIRRRLFAFLLVLLILCIISPIKSASVLSLILFIAYNIHLTINEPQIVFKYIFFFFGVAANIIGCAICEFTNVYVAEVETYAHYVGSLPLLIFSRTLFLVLIVEYEQRRGSQLTIIKRSLKINENILATATILLAVVFSIIFIKVLPYPSFGLSIDRFSYATAGTLSNFWKTITNYSHYLVVIPIVCFTYTKKKTISIIAIIIYLLFNVWMGNKFGTIFNVFSFFCLVYFSRRKIQTKKLRVLLLIGYGAIFMLIFFASVLQIRLGTSLNSTEYLFARVAQQGELWWKTFDRYKLIVHPTELLNEIPAMFRSNAAADSVGANNGIYKIMYLCTSKARVDYTLEHGARYTEAGYAAAYYYLGTVGCILFSIIMFFLAVKITNMIVEYSKRENLLAIFLAARFFMIICTAMSMFTFGDFFTRASLFSYIVLWFMSKKKIVLRKTSHKMTELTYN